MHRTKRIIIQSTDLGGSLEIEEYRNTEKRDDRGAVLVF